MEVGVFEWVFLEAPCALSPRPSPSPTCPKETSADPINSPFFAKFTRRRFLRPFFAPLFIPDQKKWWNCLYWHFFHIYIVARKEKVSNKSMRWQKSIFCFVSDVRSADHGIHCLLRKCVKFMKGKSRIEDKNRKVCNGNANLWFKQSKNTDGNIFNTF